MGKTIQIRVDESLKEILENLRKNVANKLKKEYDLTDIEVPGTLSSKILAAKMKGKKTINFKIRKKSLTKGFLELI